MAVNRYKNQTILKWIQAEDPVIFLWYKRLLALCFLPQVFLNIYYNNILLGVYCSQWCFEKSYC